MKNLVSIALVLVAFFVPVAARADGLVIPPGSGGGGGCTTANPTATVGTSAVNGSSSNCMRSDAAPAINLTMAPTWTGAHTFNPGGNALAMNWTGSQTSTSTQPLMTVTDTINGSGAIPGIVAWTFTDTAHSASTRLFQINGGSSGTTDLMDLDSNGTLSVAFDLHLVQKLSWSGVFNMSVPATGTVEMNDNSGTHAIDISLINAGQFQWGRMDAAAPVAQTMGVQNVVAGTSNTAGANWTFTGSQSTGTGAGGSIIFKTSPAGSTGTTQNTLVTAMTIDQNGHVSHTGTAPTVGTCGTSPSVTANSSDMAGELTTGTGTPTACTLTFGKAFTNAPFCTIVDRTGLANLTSYTTSTTNFVITTSAASSQKIEWQCRGL